MDYYERQEKVERWILWAICIAFGVLFLAKFAAAQERVVLSPDGEIGMMEIHEINPKIELPASFFKWEEYTGPDPIRCEDIVVILERALKHIPDYSRIDTLDHAYTTAILYLESPESRQRDAVEREQKRLKEMEEITKLHNEIKALIAKIKGEK